MMWTDPTGMVATLIITADEGWIEQFFAPKRNEFNSIGEKLKREIEVQTNEKVIHHHVKRSDEFIKSI